MATPVKLALIGAHGRMGRQIQGLLSGQGAWQLVLEISSGDDPNKVDFKAADVVLDFSTPTALSAYLPFLVEAETPLVTGTTGCDEGLQRALQAAAKTIPILQSGNMSFGVSLLRSLVADAAKRLGSDYDIEIVEAHHRDKKDAPSGTALMLGAAAKSGREKDSKEIFSRHGMVGARPYGAIGYQSIRAGGIIGDHEVRFVSGEEMISLSHRALDRALFARGALKAAAWLTAQGPGFYTMDDTTDDCLA